MILNARSSDSGLYVCQAKNEIGKTEAVTQIVVASLPEFKSKPLTNSTLFAGDILRSDCNGYDPTLVVSWERRNGLLFDHRAAVDPNGTLSITQVTTSDSGDYICELSTDGGIFKNKATLRLSVVTSKLTVIHALTLPVFFANGPLLDH